MQLKGRSVSLHPIVDGKVMVIESKRSQIEIKCSEDTVSNEHIT
jgi:hypothetical protein